MLGDVETSEELVEICHLHPDVIEWCPSSGLEDWLAWGMYPVRKCASRAFYERKLDV